MRTCRHTTRPCDNPHLACKACHVRAQAERENRTALVRRRAWFKPKVLPYVKITDHGGRNNAIEIGITGEF